ncbi:MAG: tannase/feruloyl esterase family alpha/beta hydrolase [Acidobacteria bacterium]|nr:tannase/feruloyl esterase family alpha/beta hydrolase [Acidobacteriota bacterium]
MKQKVWIILGTLLWIGGTSGTVALTQDAPNGQDRCARLLDTNFAALPDAPTHVVSASVVPASAELPEFCEVRGYVGSHVQFAVRLPTQNWNGRLLLQGCGGFCGRIPIEGTNDALKRGYAVTSNDMGHQSTPRDGKWAYNNREAEIDFGYRATHVNAVAAKAIVAAHYGKPAQYSYYRGCSTGGRQGLGSAQRFPEDFDGIVAGAPVIYYTGAAVQLMWCVLANLDAEGKPIVKPSQIPMIHKAASESCDGTDGLKDGIIEDPRNCTFDPASLLCKNPGDQNCLTAEQVAVVKKIYQGPVNSKGQKLHVGSAMVGSELNWVPDYIGEEGKPPVYLSFIGDLLRYMAFSEDPGPSYDPRSFNFDTDPARLGAMESIYNGTNPDLRKFKARGGKIIGYHGWMDQSVIPGNYLDYYELTARAMGGMDALPSFFRLFMIPGMNHCRGGPGADTIDYLTYIEDWVEKGKAPDVMIGAHVENGVTKFTRPVFPYPDVARYTGQGDVNDAANFKRVRPTK